MNMDYVRIKRGMIFWKQGEPVESRDSKFSEEKTYPWVVVSSDERNARHHVSIVPIFRISTPPKFASNYVKITFHNNPAYIMCDTLQTVQGSFLESSQYDGWVTDDVMDKVSDAIRKSLSVEYTAKDLMSISAAEQLENVIDQIIQIKLADARATLSVQDLDDAAIKISENLETLFDVKSSSNQSVEPTCNVVENQVEESAEVNIDKSEEYTAEEMPKKPMKRRWTQDAIIEFLHRFDCEDHEKLAREYHFKDVRSMVQTKRNLVRKLAES